MAKIGVIFILLVCVWNVAAKCGKCTQKNVVCLGHSTYKTCDPITELPTGSERKCPAGTFCDATRVDVCTANVVPECTCGYCNAGRFACISDREFRLCLESASNLPSSELITCPTGKYCNNGGTAPNYCAEKATSTINCGSSTTTACTQVGRFAMPGTKCKDYYVCVNSADTIVKTVYTCSGTSVFNPTLLQCSNTYVCTE